MRLAAQAKAGFYPADSVAIEGILKHLELGPIAGEKRAQKVHILDPCCGKGAAIKQIADGLGVPDGDVFTVELDAARSAEAKALMPDHAHLGPASFTGVSVSSCAFGLAYVNPPFDNELGGGRREEQAFAEKAGRLLPTGGILALVCPIGALSGNRNFCQFIDSHFKDVAVYKFPDGHRPYREIVVFGRKRSAPIPGDKLYESGALHQMQMHWGYVKIEQLPPLGGTQPVHWNNGSPSYDREPEVRTWDIPRTWRPSTFRKTAFTDAELAEAIDHSPLGRLLSEVEPVVNAAPPMPLNKGHLGLILASGMLDGVVQGPYGPHVVRGSSHKVDYHNKEASESTMNPETGAVTTKDVFSQRMVTVIRCVESDGEIRTYSNDTAEKEEAAELERERKAG
jgi:hypothetical protein